MITENEIQRISENAQIDWKGNGLFVSAGLVNLKQFSEQENFGDTDIYSNLSKKNTA